MSNKFEIGSIVEGTVTDIKPFGAFVALDERTKGLVHVSQISNNFIDNINEHISVGDKVKVKIISIDEASRKISLSIREANNMNNSSSERHSNHSNHSSSSNYRNKEYSNSPKPVAKSKQESLEDKLKDWLKQSDDRQATLSKRNKRR